MGFNSGFKALSVVSTVSAVTCRQRYEWFSSVRHIPDIQFHAVRSNPFFVQSWDVMKWV